MALRDLSPATQWPDSVPFPVKVHMATGEFDEEGNYHPSNARGVVDSTALKEIMQEVTFMNNSLSTTPTG